MNTRVNELAFAILKKNIDECSNDELRQLCVRFPYFAPLQLIYAQKLKSVIGEATASARQLQKTGLYFSNPLWLEYLLSDPATIVKTKAAPVVTTESVFQEAEVMNANPEETIPAIITEAPVPPAADEQGTAENSAAVEVETPGSDVEALTHEDETPLHEVDSTSQEADTPPEENQEIGEDGDEHVPLVPLPGLKIEPIDPATASLSFEPYHTVDYFASQGIRFKEEARPADRFSQQLKSFTEWLKTMKRLPANEAELPAEKGQVEEKVEQMAALSITDREVLTEAMAEVWEKQGDRRKAIEIYEKLSLLDPSKSAYFAAKIEVLK